jgi:hypothetical protein
MKRFSLINNSLQGVFSITPLYTLLAFSLDYFNPLIVTLYALVVQTPLIVQLLHYTLI